MLNENDACNPQYIINIYIHKYKKQQLGYNVNGKIVMF